MIQDRPGHSGAGQVDGGLRVPTSARPALATSAGGAPGIGSEWAGIGPGPGPGRRPTVGKPASAAAPMSATRYCGARRRQGPPGSRCTLPKGWGTEHPGVGPCRLHFGSTRNLTKRANQQILEAQANRYLTAYGYEPVDAPLAKLAELAGEVEAVKTYFGDRVRELAAEDLTSQTRLGAEQVHALLSCYERSLDRLAALLLGMGKLGVEERLARVSEATVLTLATTLDKVMAIPSIGIPVQQRQQVLAALAAELTHD